MGTLAMLKRSATALVVLIMIAVLAIWALQRAVGDFVFRSIAAERIVTNNLTFDDGLHLVLCGTGSPLPNAQRAGPCNLIVAGEQTYVVDIGEGGARNLNLMGMSIPTIDALLLTHYHSDHIDGIGPLSLLYWTQGTKSTPMPVLGPNGLDTVIDGFNQAYSLDHRYRVAHHSNEITPESGGGLEAQPFDITNGPITVLERDGLTISAFAVDHDPVRPAVGYRFDYKGRSIVVSGDAAKSAELEKQAAGANILVHDALQPQLVAHLTTALESAGNDNVATITRDIIDYHASPEEAAQSAQSAGVNMLVLSHLVPPIPHSFFYPTFLGDAENSFDGEIVVGEDGMIFSLPPEGEEILRDRRI